RFHQCPADPVAPCLCLDREPADPYQRIRFKNPGAADQIVATPQHQVLCPLVAVVEIGGRRVLLDDKNRLTKLQQLVEQRRRQLGPAVPPQLHLRRSCHATLLLLAASHRHRLPVSRWGRMHYNPPLTYRRESILDGTY